MSRSAWLKVFVVSALIVMMAGLQAQAQSTGTLEGIVTDNAGAVVPGASVMVRNIATGEQRTTQTDTGGRYRVSALPVGRYTVQVQAQGMETQRVTDLALEVSTTVVQNFQLKLGRVTEEVTVVAETPTVESTTITVGQVINQRAVQEIPLNGRHINDLINLVPGTVIPPQNGFLTAPLRGQGSFGAITAGNREDTVNFQVNGINLQDPVQNQTTFQPSINTVAEFKVLNNTYSAEYGHTSGAIMNVVTRSGSNEVHGEVFDFLRNDALDAKNFFDNPNTRIPPFKRNNFGAAAGGPVWLPFYDGRNRTFWFFSYEGLRQRQQVTFNRQVPTAAERATVTDPTAQKLLALIPQPNVGTNTFAGSGSAPVDIDQFTIDLSHQITSRNRFHGYWARQKDVRKEPAAPVSSSTLPGFGDIRNGLRQILTLADTHVFTDRVVNELRAGANRIEITFDAANTQDPTSAGFTGLSTFGLPEVLIQSTGLDFGGVAGFPQGRTDTTYVIADTLSWVTGKHSFKFGTEERKLFNNNFSNDMGLFLFSNFANFGAGKPSQFTFNQGASTNAVSAAAIQFFGQDNYKLLPNLTLELGYRFEWNTTPTERHNRFVAFNPATSSLRQVGTPGFSQLYPDNYNHQPRLGFAWDVFSNARTVLRAGYGIFYDQPVTNSVTGLASNPPFTSRVQINNPPSFGNPFLGTPAGAGALSPASICTCFQNSYVQNWNLNIQQEVTPTIGVMVGYVGSKGTHLRASRNINQPINGVRPFPTITLIDGTTRSGNVINEVASFGNSNYNALWITANKRMARGLQFNASYMWSKSLDYNSRNTQGIVMQNSYNPRDNYGLSDFDARHHFGMHYVYDLPFKGSKGILPARFVEGWELSGVLSAQSGNPVTITLAGTSPLTNVAGTVRPDQNGVPKLERSNFVNFFNPLVFRAPATGQFGNSRRNTVIGPRFFDWDFSLLKTTAITERVKVEFRTEFFNILNHPNFGQPGGSCNPSTVAFTVYAIPGTTFPVGTCTPNAGFGTIRNASTGAVIAPTTFGRIQTTRSPTGDAGSARQIQFALKLKF